MRRLAALGAAARCRAIAAAAAADTDDFVLPPVAAGTELALGVTRHAPPPPGQELSRLQLPVAVPRGGLPVPRSNSRAALALTGDDAAANVADKDDDDGGDHDAELRDAQRARLTAGEAAALPYDDESFAATVLEMETSGALDEAWQDTRRAHVEDAAAIARVLREMRVSDVFVVDTSEKTSSFDYLIIGTCEGPRHIHLAAWAVQEADRARRTSKVPRRHSDETWEVVPVGRIVVNLMTDAQRRELALERKWAVTRSMDPLALAAGAPVSEGRQVRSHGLWTLTLNLQDLEDFEVDYCKDVLLGQR